MLLPLPTPAEMASWDRDTINSGIPGLALMEAASRESFDVLRDAFGPVDGAVAYCFAGSGNNGGDAFALARQLHEHGAEVIIYHSKPASRYSGDAGTNLNWAKAVGVTAIHLDDADPDILPQPDIIVDGLLGTGFDGELSPAFLKLVHAINRLGERAFVLSVDIPSGLNGYTGFPCPEAVMADATVTFQAAKLGMALPGASGFTGELFIRPIGITLVAMEAHPTKFQLISQTAMNAIPTPNYAMHKGSAGRVLIAGGSPGLTGAPHLAALGALRSGAGLVTVACPAGLADSIKGGAPEIMTLPLGKGTEWTPDMTDKLLERAEGVDALVIGPGLGRGSGATRFIKTCVPHCSCRTVLDADALYALAEYPELLADLPPTTIVTPHPGEMARMLNTTTAQVQADRFAAIDHFVRLCPATLILKGAGTLVADRSTTCLSPFAEPNLAVGGSGDVLSGLLGTLLSQGLGQLQAACIGVYWHGLAGHMLKENFPLRGNIASEIAHMLPMAAKEYSAC
ncbi:NAD(P)H-hydrate dehydratase [Pseudodesulfovibrio sp.]|uniref:NAD(P)H-hydrate dehydratase n=1 Tax=unclassified Pseudodesulfovibrio TaxID=2661612 RepID=UPI003AFF92D6